MYPLIPYLINSKNLESLLLLRMIIEFDISTVFWIPNLIDNTVLCFSSITLIEKVISLSGNPFIFFTTAKMLLMSFMSQTLLLLNPISILVQFLTVNTMTPVQILSKILPRFSKHWNLNKVSVALMRKCPQQDFA